VSIIGRGNPPRLLDLAGVLYCILSVEGENKMTITTNRLTKTAFATGANMTDKIIDIADNTEDRIVKIDLLRREAVRLDSNIASLMARKREISASLSVDPILKPDILNPLYMRGLLHAYSMMSDDIAAAVENRRQVETLMALARKVEPQP